MYKNLFNKNSLKKERGITLIALIITIIILVILAAVSVAAVYNMGIVNYAVNGTQNYAKAAVEENSIMNKSGNLIENTIGKLDVVTNGADKEKDQDTSVISVKDYFVVKHDIIAIADVNKFKDEGIDIKAEDISWYKVDSKDDLNKEELLASSKLYYAVETGTIEIADAILTQKDDTNHIAVYLLFV